MTCFFSFGRWFGFYLHRGNLFRIGLGLFELSFTMGERGHTTDFIEGIMGTSGEAARKIDENPMKTGYKLPVGFVALDNGQQAELRVELESNSEKFLGEEAFEEVVGESPDNRPKNQEEAD